MRALGQKLDMKDQTFQELNEFMKKKAVKNRQNAENIIEKAVLFEYEGTSASKATRFMKDAVKKTLTTLKENGRKKNIGKLFFLKKKKTFFLFRLFLKQFVIVKKKTKKIK